MKTILHSFVATSAVAIGLLCYAASSFAAVDAYIIFKSNDGKETKVSIGADGSFTSQALAAGAYRWRVVYRPTISSGTTDRESSAPSVSEIARVKVKFYWDRSAGERKQIGKPKYEDITVTKSADQGSASLSASSGSGDELTVEADGVISGTIEFVTTSGKTIQFKEFSPAEEQLKGNPRH